MPRRTTVTFSDHSWATLEELSEQSGASMAEVLRRALSMYLWFRETRASGGHVLVEKPSGTFRELVAFD